MTSLAEKAGANISPAPEKVGPRVQLVVPIHNEGESVQQLYRGLVDGGVEFDSLSFVYDLAEDTSIPFIAAIGAEDGRVSGVRNTYGRGVVRALRFGFDRTVSGPVIVVMGDCSDKLDIIPEMISLWKKGATIVCPSRYMKGGSQVGGGILKASLSRLAGKSLFWFGLPTSDATNNFKLYDGDWLRAQQIESNGGFEVALELCYKAFLQGKKIVELPTTWQDRTVGESKFRVWAWLPHYLRWYFRLLFALAFRPNVKK